MMEEKRIVYVDSLRGMACLFVVVSHIISVSKYGIYVSGCGKIGVWLFMILSSFLMIYPYEICRNKKFNICMFYYKRILRIYPCYLVALLLAYECGFITTGKSFIRHIFILEGWGHFWYIPVIVKFYMIFPVFVYIRKNIKRDFWYLTVVGGISIGFSCLFPYNHYIENSISIGWYMPVFGMGLCLATIVRKLEKNQCNYRLADIGLVFCLSVVFLLTPFMKKLIWRIEPSAWLQNKYLLLGLLWCMVIVLIEIGAKGKQILNKCSILIKIGSISYPMYLIHYIILLKIVCYTNKFWIISIFTFVISFILSEMIHYFIEERITK